MRSFPIASLSQGETGGGLKCFCERPRLNPLLKGEENRIRGIAYYLPFLEAQPLIPPPLRGRREGVLELYSERPHLNPPLKGEQVL